MQACDAIPQEAFQKGAARVFHLHHICIARLTKVWTKLFHEILHYTISTSTRQQALTYTSTTPAYKIMAQESLLPIIGARNFVHVRYTQGVIILPHIHTDSPAALRLTHTTKHTTPHPHSFQYFRHLAPGML